MIQQKLTNENLKDRVYFTAQYDWKTKTSGKAIIFPKPYTTTPFSKQTPQRILTITQYNKEYKQQIKEPKWKENTHAYFAEPTDQKKNFSPINRPTGY